jgi:hypothetical protein
MREGRGRRGRRGRREQEERRREGEIRRREGEEGEKCTGKFHVGGTMANTMDCEIPDGC